MAYMQLFMLTMALPAVVGTAVRNERPIIGIMAQSSKGLSFEKFGDSYIESSYVNYIYMAGARAVPIRIKESDEYYEDLFSKINGVLFPGGPQYPLMESYYAAAGTKMYNMAIKSNDNNEPFPMWGTCQGFEFLSMVTGGNQVLTHCQGDNMTLPLDFKKDFKNSRLFADLPDDLYEIASDYPITQNHHSFCVTETSLHATEKLKQFYHILTTSVDKIGETFISTMEAYDYPFYGVQYHPEKNVYDWQLKQAVNHSMGAVRFSQYLADFFVEEARKSSHKFPSPEEESELIFENYHPYYEGYPTFHSIYLFNFSKDGQEVEKKEDDRKIISSHKNAVDRYVIFALLGTIVVLLLYIIIKNVSNRKKTIIPYHAVSQYHSTSDDHVVSQYHSTRDAKITQ